jgi:hypothetical protein
VETGSTENNEPFKKSSEKMFSAAEVHGLEIEWDGDSFCHIVVSKTAQKGRN